MQQLRVRAVEGRSILHHATVGSARQHRIGHERKVEEPRLENGRLVAGKIVRGKPEPRVRFCMAKDAKPELVTETADLYYRTAILNGDLDYEGHVEVELKDGAYVEGRSWKEPALVRATALNRKARDAAKTAADKTAKAEKDLLERELRAAEEGVSLEEFDARETAKTAPKPEKLATDPKPASPS